ncbi:MAG: PP2C family protein-serine/threonine phosphatase, partial [Bacteroidota bacterium]
PLPFTTHVVPVLGETIIYLFTDGFADQFGGPKGKKFKYKQLEESALSFSSLPMKEQKEALWKKFMSWKGSLEQIDDVCLLGIKF